MFRNKLFYSLALLSLIVQGCQASPSSAPDMPGASVSASSISGQVRDAKGALVAGATVKAVPVNAGPEAVPYETVTDASGRFVVGVPANGQFNLVAESMRLSQTAIRFHVMSGTTTADIDLTPTTTISGTVSLSPSGSPEGALVFIPGTSYMATAKADGTYTMTGVPVGTHAVKASLAGCATASAGSVTTSVATPATSANISLVAASSALAHGYGYELATLADATVVGGADVPFSNNGPMSGVTHTAGTTTFTVPTAGTYKISYKLNLTAGIGSALAIAVNGTVDASTNVSALVATGQVGGQAVLTLAAGDVITLRNNSAVPLTMNLAPAVGAQLTIEQI